MGESKRTASCVAGADREPESLIRVGRALEEYLRPHGEDIVALCRGCSSTDVRNSVRGLEELVRSKQRREPKILRRMDPVLTGIEHYSEVFGIFMQAYPLVLAPLWGSIRLLVQVLRSYTAYADEILDKLQQIQLSMPRYHEYVALFPDEARLVDAVTSTYLLVVEYCVLVRKILLGPSDGAAFLVKVKRRLRPLGQPIESVFKRIMDQMQCQKKRIESEAKAAGLKSLDQVKRDGKERYDILVQQSTKTEVLQQQTLEVVKSSLNEIRSQQYQEICQWLQSGLEGTDLGAQERLEELNRSWHPGTCQWLFEKPQFLAWLAQKQGILLVRGPPGCGKSVLAARCLWKFQLENATSPPFFFFGDQRVPAYSKWEFVLRAWAIRIIRKGLSNPQLEQILGLVRNGDAADCMSILHAIVQQDMENSKRFVVLDALDELTDRRKALRDLQEMALKTKILVFSREESDILHALLSHTDVYWNETIVIRAEDTQEDVKNVVSGWTDTHTRLPRPLTEAAREKVVNGAQGMFLWVRLILNELEDQLTEEDFRQTLEKMPSGLDSFFGRFMSRLRQTSPSQLKYIKLVLLWATFSVDILTIGITEHVLAFGLEGQTARPVFDTHSIVGRCSPLLQILPDGRIQVLHLSVLDYLRSKGGAIFEDPGCDIDSAGHNALFRICMRFLLNAVQNEDDFSKMSAMLAEKHSFLEYAARHVWTHLFRSGPPDSEKLDLLKEFFGESGKKALWVEITSILGIDFRLRDHLRIQSGLRNWLKEYKQVLISDSSAIKQIEGGLRALYLSAVKCSIAKYGQDDARTAKATHALGSFLFSNGHIQQALFYFKLSLSRFEASKGFNQEHPDYLALLTELSTCQVDIEPMDLNAEKNMRRAYEGSIVAHGNGHPVTLHNGVMLAEIWRGRKEYDRAIVMFHSTLEISANVLGQEHITTLRGYHNLGRTYVETGKYDEAEKYLKLAESTRRRVFGLNNQSTLRSMTCLGELYCKRQKYDEALQLIGDSLDGLKKIHGSHNYFVFLATESLGDVWFQKGGFEVAQQLYREALDGTVAQSGTETSETAKIRDKLAETYCRIGVPREAESLMDEATQTRSKVMGEFHPETIASKERLIRLREGLKHTSPTVAMVLPGLNFAGSPPALAFFLALVFWYIFSRN